MSSPEELARKNIDALLKQCGWIIQKRSEINLSAGHGIAITEDLLKVGDEVDYLVFSDGKAIAAVEGGSCVEKRFYVDKRDRLTRKVRWGHLDEDLDYAPNELDRAVVAPDQIRTFCERLFTEIFPGRSVVPKSHATRQATRQAHSTKPVIAFGETCH
jgi:hypothetical protein